MKTQAETRFGQYRKFLASSARYTVRAGCSTHRLTSKFNSRVNLARIAPQKIKRLTRGFWRGAMRYEITLELTTRITLTCTSARGTTGPKATPTFNFHLTGQSF